MKLLILGQARHGKDTVAEILHKESGLKFTSSSMFAAKKFIFNILAEDKGYENVEECYMDRVNCREEWYILISAYNIPDRSTLCREILKDNDIYVGMRNLKEFEASRLFFDLVIWVDASKRVPPENSTSISISKDKADIVIDNNGTLDELITKVQRLSDSLKI